MDSSVVVVEVESRIFVPIFNHISDSWLQRISN